MHRQTEDMKTYAWRRTIYSTPGKLILWWQLPVDEAVQYYYRYTGDNAVLFTLHTEDDVYTSLVTIKRAMMLAGELDAYLALDPPD